MRSAVASAALRCTRMNVRVPSPRIFDGRERSFDQFAARDLAGRQQARGSEESWAHPQGNGTGKQVRGPAPMRRSCPRLRGRHRAETGGLLCHS
jgi:hypothetical protein